MEFYDRVGGGGEGRLEMADRALFRLSGDDRVRYLNGQITNDVARLKVGQAMYGAVLTGKGKLVSDLFVAASEGALWIDTPLELRTEARERLEKFLIADDALLEDVTALYQLTHVWSRDLSTNPFQFTNARFGLPGVDLWEKAGERSLVADLPIIPQEIVEILRVEFALGKWGKELDHNTLPQEGLFERHGLSYEKGCYVGQETVARIRSIGHVNRQLASLELIDGPSPVLPSRLMASGVEAGKLTSLVFSPSFNKLIGLGMVSRKVSKIGEDLTTENCRLKVIEPPRKLA